MGPNRAASHFLSRERAVWVRKMENICLTNIRDAEKIMEAHSSWNQKALKWT